MRSPAGSANRHRAGDDFFNKSHGKSLYAGQWVMIPARANVQEQWSTERELGVIYEIGKDKIPVFHCIDGEDILCFPPNMQLLYSAKQPFKLFKLAALEGDQEKTTRFELSSRRSACSPSMQWKTGIFSFPIS